MKQISCAEVGFFPYCPDLMQGANDEEVMAAAVVHGTSAHGMTDADFSDENVAIVRSHIKDV